MGEMPLHESAYDATIRDLLRRRRLAGPRYSAIAIRLQMGSDLCSILVTQLTAGMPSLKGPS